MEGMASVINATPNGSIKVPSTKYKLKMLIPPALNTEIHIKCVNCGNYMSSAKSQTECELCKVLIKTTDLDYFVYIPIKQQLLLTLSRNLSDIILYATTVSLSNQISDLQNAELFKNAQKKYPNAILLPLILNTDGAKVFKSNQKSLWLIQAYQAYLPPSVRYFTQNILIVAAHFGAHKPDMTAFFYPLLKELREITRIGGLCFENDKKKYEFMPIIIACSCDLPAKASLQGMVGHSGKFGCSYCLHPGKLVKKDPKSKSVIRYTNEKHNYAVRTHQEVIETYSRIRSSPINGIKNMSCMISAFEFDLIHGFSIDVMHCVYLGVMKKILKLWLDQTNKSQPFYINKNRQIALSGRLVKIKLVTEIVRKPKSLFCKGEFKANEFRNLLLYFLPFALTKLHETKYIKHFHLLSYAIYTLSKKFVSLVEIETARAQLKEFVQKFEHLYGRSNVTMNLHLLNHLPTSVEKLGPLWVSSMFAFEANNGVVIQGNASKKDIVHQLAYKYTMKQTLKKDDAVAEISLNGKQVKIMSTAEKALFYGEFGNIMQNSNRLIIYKCVMMRKIKYTSESSKEVATIDYFVRLKNGMICSINYFTLIDLNVYALVTVYEITNEAGHFIEIKRSQTQKLVKMIEIAGKMLYMQYGKTEEFVTVFPNTYEKT